MGVLNYSSPLWNDRKGDARYLKHKEFMVSTMVNTGGILKVVKFWDLIKAYYL